MHGLDKQQRTSSMGMVSSLSLLASASGISLFEKRSLMIDFYHHLRIWQQGFWGFPINSWWESGIEKSFWIRWRFISYVKHGFEKPNFYAYLPSLRTTTTTTITGDGGTGEHSIYTEFQGLEIMFHVATYIPFSPNDRQQVARKRHLGNDIAVVLFKDIGKIPSGLWATNIGAGGLTTQPHRRIERRGRL